MKFHSLGHHYSYVLRMSLCFYRGFYLTNQFSSIRTSRPSLWSRNTRQMFEGFFTINLTLNSIITSHLLRNFLPITFHLSPCKQIMTVMNISIGLWSGVVLFCRQCFDLKYFQLCKETVSTYLLKLIQELYHFDSPISVIMK